LEGIIEEKEHDELLKLVKIAEQHNAKWLEALETVLIYDKKKYTNPDQY